MILSFFLSVLLLARECNLPLVYRLKLWVCVVISGGKAQTRPFHFISCIFCDSGGEAMLIIVLGTPQPREHRCARLYFLASLFLSLL